MKASFNCLIFLLIPALISCNQNGSHSAAGLRDKVMAIHDEIMPMSEEITSIGVEIKNQLNATVTDTAIVDSVRVSDAIEILDKLHLADKHMWDWMHDFTGNENKVNKGEKIIFYQAELNKMEALKAEMDSCIEAGKKWLKDRPE
jgi:hypothetical protein